ncbi:hypothetical protein SDC9_116147 [bioreactor metagenome]|uniref:t-SNARE coiled-coil homology domain-containing protein n=1 Tax=bioreactor metagenome TaxID=1076179 RepID=A0A645C1I8_9ZZZZ
MKAQKQHSSYTRDDDKTSYKDILLNISDKIAKIDQRMDRIDKKIDKVDQRIDHIENKLDNLSSDTTSIKVDVGGLKFQQEESMRRYHEDVVRKRWYCGIVFTVIVGVMKFFY